ncbi:MAG: polyphosphate polymerase domain-containing protein [Bdellovibrionota bacterium]
MAGPVSPLFLERYELKYRIPMSLVRPISNFIESFCEMDHYSATSPDHFYTINSLYLDSPRLFFLQQKEAGVSNRFSMRIRSYGDDPKPPYFFETKYKMREFVKKRRGKVGLTNWAELFDRPELVEELEEDSRDNARHFLDIASIYNASPVIFAQYRRLAYISTIDDYARVTFDRDLRYMPTNEFTVKPVEKRMVHYDDLEAFIEPGTNVVLELKCERKVPVWIVDLIRQFDLTQGSFSKYHSSMAHQHQSLWGEEAFDMFPGEGFAPLLSR